MYFEKGRVLTAPRLTPIHPPPVCACSCARVWLSRNLPTKRTAVHVGRSFVAPNSGGVQLALRRPGREPAVQHVQPRVRALLHAGLDAAGHRGLGRGTAVPGRPYLE